MTEEQRLRIAQLLIGKRTQLGWSAAKVGRRAGLCTSTVVRLEKGAIRNPGGAILRNIADALGLPVADLFIAADWLPAGQLPNLQPYLRARYPDLPADAVGEIVWYTTHILDKYRPETP